MANEIHHSRVHRHTAVELGVGDARRAHCAEKFECNCRRLGRRFFAVIHTSKSAKSFLRPICRISNFIFIPNQQATANTRLVGLEIAYLIKKLQQEHELRPEDVHLIGHSLGAHTAAYAAERIPGIGRITGLDPAEPYFQGMGPQVRLDPSDAMFVDVIHTDARSFFLLEIPGYGMSQACGHIDFYPNNGKAHCGKKAAMKHPYNGIFVHTFQ